MSMLGHKKRLVWLLLVITLSACSTSSEKGKYRVNREADRPLEVPPELTRPEGSDTLAVPVVTTGQSVSSRSARAGGVKRDPSLLPATPGGKLVQQDGLRWLEIDASPEVIWREIQGFFRSQGFEIKYKDPTLGIVQTSWLKDEVYKSSSWLAGLLNKLYSSSLMDSYRARLERTDDPDKTRLYITHQGLEEVAINEDLPTEVVETRWQPRASDPELEAEMMLRFLVFRGMNEDEAKKATVVKKATKQTVLQDVEGGQVLVVPENFARTWRRIGLAIDRMGLLVEDRNRAEGLYYIKLSEDFLKRREEEEGLMSKLFGGKENKQTRFIIKVEERGEQCRVSLHGADGKLSNTPTAQMLMKQLYTQMR